MAVNAASTDAASRTSHWTTDSPSTGSPDREVTVTLSPSAASRRAIASPIPRFPPVTSTERPTFTLQPVHESDSRAYRPTQQRPRPARLHLAATRESPRCRLPRRSARPFCRNPPETTLRQPPVVLGFPCQRGEILLEGGSPMAGETRRKFD